jgi:NAD(P) transhydrogenase subunit alpha
VLAIFVGVEVISKVPTLLHTPLMSGTNAIHGIVLVGAIIVAGLPHQVTWIRVVALTAVALGTINVVGGFVVTDRMLAMFKGKRRDAEPAQPAIGEGGRVERVREHREARATSTSDHDGR